MTVTSFLRDMRWSKFDVGIAALAAFSAGFVAYAIPDWRLFQLIFTLRLNDIVPALNPPLGNTIRLAAMAGGAAFAFAAVFGLMRLLDRVPSRRRGTAEAVPEVLRLRRADTHPDAPARRPILAGRELGEPAPAPEAEATQAPAATIPDFLAVRQPEEAVEDDAPADTLELIEAEEPETLELTQAEPEPEPAVIEPAAVAPAPVAVAPAPAPQPAAEAEDGEDDETEEEGAQAEDDGGESLSKLMRRLESGIGRREAAAEPARPVRAKREQALPPRPGEDAAPAPEPAAEAEPPARHRLRSAIQDLEKLAGSR